jgi:hypothetical protein
MDQIQLTSVLEDLSLLRRFKELLDKKRNDMPVKSVSRGRLASIDDEGENVSLQEILNPPNNQSVSKLQKERSQSPIRSFLGSLSVLTGSKSKTVSVMTSSNQKRERLIGPTNRSAITSVVADTYPLRLDSTEDVQAEMSLALTSNIIGSPTPMDVLPLHADQTRNGVSSSSAKERPALQSSYELSSMLRDPQTKVAIIRSKSVNELQQQRAFERQQSNSSLAYGKSGSIDALEWPVATLPCPSFFKSAQMKICDLIREIEHIKIELDQFSSKFADQKRLRRLSLMMKALTSELQSSIQTRQQCGRAFISSMFENV